MTSFIERWRRAVGAFKATEGRVTTWGNVGWSTVYDTLDPTLPGASADWQSRAGDLWRNSAVMACLDWIANRFAEAHPEVVVTGSDGQEKPVPNHALVQLLRRPAPSMSGNRLWRCTLLSYCVNGNAYWVKVRSRAGAVVGLQYIYHTRMKPVRLGGSSNFVDHYEYKPGPNRKVIYTPEDVVHFRNGTNPENEMEGFAPLRVAYREIATDNEYTTYEAAIAKNFGVVGVMLVPDAGTRITPDTAKSLKDAWATQFTGENRGKPWVPAVPVKPERLAMTPEEMALNIARRVPETRICALLRVKPTTIGLAVGEEQRTYANVKEDSEQSVESAVLPTQAAMAEELDLQLLPEFSQSDVERVGWNNDHIRALAQDMSQLRKDAVLLYQGEVCTRAQAKELAGLPFVAEDDVYFSQARAAAAAGAMGGGEGEPAEG